MRAWQTYSAITMLAFTRWGGTTTLLVVCGLLGIEEAGLPLLFMPGDLIAATGGYAASEHLISLPLLVASTWAATVVGALICYTLSARLGRPALVHWGRYVGLTPRRLDQASTWLQARGSLGIFIARILPGTRINASYAAGALLMKRRTFIIGVLPSAAIWVTGTTMVGYLAGQRMMGLLLPLDGLLPWALAIAAVTLLIFAIRRHHHSSATTSPSLEVVGHLTERAPLPVTVRRG